MNLYKFTSASTAKKILRDCAIRFTPPIEFNDPFEVSPHFFDMFGKDFLKNTLENSSQEEYSSQEKFITQIKLSAPDTYMNFPNEIKSIISYNEFEKIILNFSKTSEFIEFANIFFNFGSTMISEGLNKNFQLSMSTIFGVLCLAGHPFSELMWAHYADSHKGVAIVFFEQHDFFQQMNSETENIRRCRQVIYSKQPPIFTDLYTKAHKQGMADEFMTKMYFTKSDAWSYEEEFRCIRPLIEADKVEVKNGKNIHLFNFPLDCLQGVIFGARCSENDQIEILSILNELYSRNRKYAAMKMVIDISKYELYPGLIDSTNI